jgi:hypothetical protein
VSGRSSQAGRNMLRRGEVKFLCVDTVRRRGCYLGSLNQQATHSRGDEGALWWKSPRLSLQARSISPWAMFVVSMGWIPNRRRRTQAYLALAHAVPEAGLRCRLDLAIESPFHNVSNLDVASDDSSWML